jgi:hypothetical protein
MYDDRKSLETSASRYHAAGGAIIGPSQTTETDSNETTVGLCASP